MRELEPSWRRVARVWWAFTWRYVVIGWGLTLLLFLLLLLLGVAYDPNTYSGLASGLIAIAIQVGAQLWALRQVIGTDFDDFRVTLAETFVQAQLRELEEGGAPT